MSTAVLHAPVSGARSSQYLRPRLGKGDIDSVLDRAWAAAPGTPKVIFNFDFDGPLGPMTDRSGYVPFPDGTWPVDAVVPPSTISTFNRLRRHAVATIVTGGAALRGKKLSRAERVWVSGAEGAEFYDPRERRVIPNQEFDAIAPIIGSIVMEVNEGLGDRLANQADPRRPIVAEPKGLLTNTWHPKDDEIIGRLDVAANQAGYFWDGGENAGVRTYRHQDGTAIELLVDEKNNALTIRPEGISKERSIETTIKTVESVHGVSDISIFIGDGSTDKHAVLGGRKLQAERIYGDNPNFRFLAFAAVTERGLDFELAQMSDGVVLGAGITHEFVWEKYQNDADFRRTMDDLGITTRARYAGERESATESSRQAIFGLSTVEDLMDKVSERTPEREIQPFEADDFGLGGDGERPTDRPLALT